MFRSQRINDIVYIESGDGRIRLVYPYKNGAQVKGLIDAAELMLTENDPQLQVGQAVAGTENAAALFGRASALSGFGEKKPKKHREAKKLVNAAGEEFKIGELIEEKVKLAKGHKILFADVVEELKHHYKQNPHHTKNAIRISAMKSERFSIAGDYLVARVPAPGGKKAV